MGKCLGQKRTDFKHICNKLPQEGSRESFWHGAEFFTKDLVAFKINLVRNKYRNASDLGKASGAGKIIASFYDICNEVLSR